ncbi:MAG: CocE/NonD family hydrolase [Chloroflexi bacterium]|nr:CocE/NonD family hydrolase [Chloroflexota bacterium]
MLGLGFIGRKLGLRPAQFKVGIERNARVQMADGVELHTDHYYPRGEGRFPTILSRSPYYGGRWSRSDRPGLLDLFFAPLFAERGYHFLMQTTRGRFDSGGEFAPCTTEQQDGRATLDWIAQQSWFDGNVGMWGASYLGHVQWAVAVDAPSALKAIVPTITGSSFSPLLFPDDVPGDFPLLYATAMDLANRPSANTLSLLLQSSPNVLGRVLNRALNHLPLCEADASATGHAIAYYRDWLAHGPPDPAYWRAVDHRERIAQVTASAHIITGWYDFCSRGALDDYRALRAAGQTPYLTVGPYPHGPQAAIDSVRLGLDWFDACLKGERRKLRAKPVRVFVMGARGGQWREFDEWPTSAVRSTRFYLQGDRKLGMARPAPGSPPDRYRYDPADPTPATGNLALFAPMGPQDNRRLEARADVVCYTTAPLEREVEVIGPVMLELFVGSSLTHTDFVGRLCDAHPDGRSINICEGLFRVAPGRGERQPDGSLLIHVDLWATGQRFERGHAIRLQVASGAHPR